MLQMCFYLFEGLVHNFNLYLFLWSVWCFKFPTVFGICFDLFSPVSSSVFCFESQLCSPSICVYVSSCVVLLLHFHSSLIVCLLVSYATCSPSPLSALCISIWVPVLCVESQCHVSHHVLPSETLPLFFHNFYFALAWLDFVFLVVGC